MQLQVGKRYRSRDGEIFGPIDASSTVVYEGVRYPFRSPQASYTWTLDGRHDSSPNGLDLVEEVQSLAEASQAFDPSMGDPNVVVTKIGAASALAGGSNSVAASRGYSAVEAAAEVKYDGSTRDSADPVTVGDLNSKARGTGARKSSGKPDWSQIPWWVVDSLFHAWKRHEIRERSDGLLKVINLMAEWQRGQNDSLDHATALLLEIIHAPAGRDNKAEWFPVRALESTVQVLEFGAKKYAKGNWARGMSWSVCFTCTMSHLSKAFQGEENDEESGLPHTAHAMCNMLFLLGYRDLFPEGDDRLPEFQPGGINGVDKRHD